MGAGGGGRGTRWGAAGLSTAEALELLSVARLEIEGRLVQASNTTLYCTLRPVTRRAGGGSAAGAGPDAGSAAGAAIYKPVSGERPLQDFPDGTLAHRERAAWLLSEAAGWTLVPPTLIRDGPLGEGMVQIWVEVDPDADVLALILTRDERLRPMALFDVIANNADRKGGHVLVTLQGAVHGCDHGICFASDPKLRTLLWGWAGEELLDEEVEALERVRAGLHAHLGHELRTLLSEAEVAALERRVDTLLSDPRFPSPEPGRRVIPWPPF